MIIIVALLEYFQRGIKTTEIIKLEKEMGLGDLRSLITKIMSWLCIRVDYKKDKPFKIKHEGTYHALNKIRNAYENFDQVFLLTEKEMVFHENMTTEEILAIENYVKMNYRPKLKW